MSHSVASLLLALSCSALVAQGCPTPTCPVASNAYPLSPVVLYGPDVTCEITGTGFNPGDLVYFGPAGTHAWSHFGTTYVNSTTLRATMPAAFLADQSLGYNGIHVGLQPSWFSGEPLIITIFGATLPHATITSVTPGAVLAGSGPVTITVTGSYLVPNSELVVTGSGIPTTNLPSVANPSTSEMSFFIPATLLSAPGTLTLTLLNDPSYGQTSQTGSAPTYNLPVHPGAFEGTLACLSGVSGHAVTLNVAHGTPGAVYQVLFSQSNVGVAPNGWLLGLDITINELNSQIGVPPLFGVLDSNGFAGAGITVPACPFGVTLDMVTLEFSPSTSNLLQFDTAKTVSF